MDGGITRVWARKVLEDLEKEGILGHVDLRPPRRKDDTPHYYLRRDCHALCGTILMLGERMVADGRLYRGVLNLVEEPFIADVLHDKGYAMNRLMKLWSMDRREIEDEFARRRDLRGGDEDIRDVRDYLLQSIDYLYDDDVSDDATSVYDSEVSLPVLPAVPDADILRSDPEAPGQEALLGYDAVRDHYQFHQRSNLVLPVLYMVAKSPSALLRFISAPRYEPPEKKGDFSPQGTEALNDLMFQLITATISDMASFGDDSGSRSHVALRPQVDGACPLMLITDGTLDIMYDASFDTSMRRMMNREGDYRQEQRRRTSTFIDIRTRMRVSPYSGLSDEGVMDFERLIRELRRGKDPVMRVLLDSLPNRFQNVIEKLGPGVHWYEGLRSEMLLHLNLSLMECDLMEEGKIPEEVIPEEHLRFHRWAILNDTGFDGYELLRSNLIILRTLYPHLFHQNRTPDRA